MIKVIDFHEQLDLKSFINSYCREASHIILKDKNTQVRDEAVNHTALDDHTFIVDYTNNGYYTNDSRYMGKAFITVNDWFNNITLQPNMIFRKEDLKWLISNVEWENIFDITLNALIYLDEIKIDSHVVFNFNHQNKPSAQCLKSFKGQNIDSESKFYINKLAILSSIKPVFDTKEINLPYNVRTIDKIMLKTKFKLPKSAYQNLNKKAIQKQMQSINIYEKDKSQLKPYIVFLGFDFGYRGNSKYLFEYITEHHSRYTVYFVTKDKKGAHFISPDHASINDVIEKASVVILESYLPDHIKPNGTIIQLWHGTPLKRLFLDSKEPKQNNDIYNYRARKYNKLIKQDYFITDVASINYVFESAFPMHETKIVSCGYPRNQYLLEYQTNTNEVDHIKQLLNLDKDKETILYTPTWRDNKENDFLLVFPEEIKSKYNIIYKYHEEDQSNKHKNDIDINQFETQQLILVSDIVISDYSSIIFDALTIDKKVYLYTPDFKDYDYHRGLYKHVYELINENQYFEKALLFKAIMDNQYNMINDKYINKNNDSYEAITQLIEDAMI